MILYLSQFIITITILLIINELIKTNCTEINNRSTGSWVDCTTIDGSLSGIFNISGHPDSDVVHISCTYIHCRIPKESLMQTSSRIIIGVLSSATEKGLNRRNSIRSTWGYRRNVFFIVAGLWEYIESEYYQYKDLLWIDREEVYETEISVLTFKTGSFLSVAYKNILHFSYLFKTDDDSYVNVEDLHKVLLTEESTRFVDYWGKCNNGGWKPHRDYDIPWQKKWYISYDIYPESSYPPYCQGAGFALSRRFLDCAIGEKNLDIIRYMPNEDVAIGLLAERCNINPCNDERVWIRWLSSELSMIGKVVQHYVKTENEMHAHHKNCINTNNPVPIDNSTNPDIIG